MENEKQEKGKVAEEKVTEKKEVVKPEELKKQPELKKRQIIIETDGNSVNLVRAEVAGNLELRAILQGLADELKPKKM